MKILYIANPRIPDFQADMVFLGGRSLFGSDFVDLNKNWYSYKEDKAKYWKDRIPGRDHGSGFTLHGKLEETPVDRGDVESKIKSKFFDYVFYGNINRCADHINLVKEHYPRNKVILIDGEDDTYIRSGLEKVGLYFKRELTESNGERTGVFPINFCLPKNYYLEKVPAKTKMFAHIIPGQLDTYIYGMDDEDKYHKDYQDSCFGVTTKKAGWDCNRHYEILINGCVPYFIGLENCPRTIMVPFPKQKLINIRQSLDKEEYTENQYTEDAAWILDYSKKYLTSEATVEKILSTKL
jgi:hypothetical protein